MGEARPSVAEWMRSVCGAVNRPSDSGAVLPSVGVWERSVCGGSGGSGGRVDRALVRTIMHYHALLSTTFIDYIY